jgi:hypothetical protein
MDPSYFCKNTFFACDTLGAVAGHLVEWDPFRVRVNAAAITDILNEGRGAAAIIDGLALTFGNGRVDVSGTVAGAPLRALVTIDRAAGHELRLAVAIHAGRPALPPKIASLLPPPAGDVLSIEPMIVTLSIASLLPAFADVTLAAAEIDPEGLLLSLAAGGADAPAA